MPLPDPDTGALVCVLDVEGGGANLLSETIVYRFGVQLPVLCILYKFWEVTRRVVVALPAAHPNAGECAPVVVRSRVEECFVIVPPLCACDCENIYVEVSQGMACVIRFTAGVILLL